MCRRRPAPVASREDDSRLNANDDTRPPILSPEERRQRNRRETIAAILSVSRDIMRQEGVGALTLNEIARRVGMSAPSLYHYFDSKMAVYEAVFAQGMRQYRRRLEEIAAAYGPTAEGRKAAMTAYLRFALENPELFHLLFERPVPGFVPSEEGLAEAQRLMAMADGLVQQEQAAGGIDPAIRPEQARDLLVAMMHGLTALHLANEPHLPLGEGRFGGLIPLAARAIDLLYRHGPESE